MRNTQLWRQSGHRIQGVLLMGCECGEPVVQIAPSQRRSRAVMCDCCKHSDGLQCRKSGFGALVIVSAPKAICPIRRHPNENGVVRWLGIEWYGVPAPIRWRVKKHLSGTLGGCGCIRRLKDLWVRITRNLYRGTT